MLKTLLDRIANFSPREQMLALVASLVLITTGVLYVYDEVNHVFISQAKELKKSREELALLPNQLERYLELYRKQQQIEKDYQSVEFKDGVLSYLEDLIRAEAKITTNAEYKINPMPLRPFGGSYTQEPFRLELQITSMDNLANFLQALVRGPKPLVLTNLDIKKAAGNAKLVVQLDVSNFKRI